MVEYYTKTINLISHLVQGILLLHEVTEECQALQMSVIALREDMQKMNWDCYTPNSKTHYQMVLQKTKLS